MKRVMAKADQFDTLYNKRWKTAKAQGLLVGASGYWEAPTSSKTTKPIKAVTQDLVQDQYEHSNIHQIATNATAIHSAASTTVGLDSLDREAIRMKTQIHQFQTDIKGSVDTLKVDFDKRLKIVETTTDATQTMCQQILNNQMKPPAQANSPTSYPAAETHNHGNYYSNPNTSYYQNQGKGYGGGKGYYGGGKGTKGRPRGACYGCGARDHQVASCPKINNQNTPGYLGTASVNAVAGDVLASANAINYGGTKEISDWELHEQMEDGDGEHDATTIAHIAIGWATNILSPQTGNSCALKSKPKILMPQVQLTHGAMTHLERNTARSKHMYGTCTTCTTDHTTEQNHRLQTDYGHNDGKTAPEVEQDIKVVSPANGEIIESVVLDMIHQDKDKILSWLLKHVNLPYEEPDKGLQPTTRKSQSETGPCQVLPLSFEDQLGTPDLLAVPSGAAFIPAFVPDDMTFASDDIDPVPDDIAPDESRSMKPVASPRPPSSRRAWEAPSVQQAIGGTPSQDQTECLRGQYLRHTSGFKCAGAVSFGVWDDQHPDQRPLPSHDISEIPQETDKVGDTDQTLLMAPYTGSCGSAMCPEISVPKCHDERVSFGADDPISGEVCLDCAFIQACNTTQEHEARSEQVGGASMPARDRVVGCPAMLSTVGTELSSLVASDSTEASDRAAVQTPCCHGVQRKADGIRVSHVSIVGDGPISGVELADSKRPKTIAKDPRQDEVGEELCDQSGAGSPQSCPVEIEARSRTATPRVEHVSAVADDPISGGYGCRNNKECVIPRLVDDDTSSGEEDDNSDDTSSGEEDYNSDSDGENEGEETWYDAINGHKCRWQENENIVSTESNDTGDVNEEESNASVKTTQHADDEFTDEGEYWASYNTVADTPTRRQLKRWAQSRRKHNLITAHSNDGIKCKRGTMVNEPMVNRRPLYLLSIYHLANKE